MLIVFTKHALKKLEQRKIHKQFVLETIEKPDLLRPSYGFREELYKKFGKNYMEVVIKKFGIKTLVLTAHWVAKIQNKF